MERETKTIETPCDKIKVVIYTYATGREAKAIEAKYLSMVKVTMSPSMQPEFKEFNPDATFDAEAEMLKQLVVSIDVAGDKPILEKILDLRQEDYEFIVSEVNAVTKKKS